ncbi:MAG: hypothetical protein JW722_01255 [Demequinaceae bacterium]|nr:hypothetical protein [Demequinaceae bacterium]
MRTQTISRQSIGMFLAAFAALGLMVSLNVQHSLDMSEAPGTLPLSAGMRP